jgi:hypothetical protein
MRSDLWQSDLADAEVKSEGPADAGRWMIWVYFLYTGWGVACPPWYLSSLWPSVGSGY